MRSEELRSKPLARFLISTLHSPNSTLKKGGCEMANVNLSQAILEVNCPRCGKAFCPTPMWVLKVKNKPVCSISCMWAMEAEAAKKKPARPRPELEQYEYVPDREVNIRGRLTDEERAKILAMVLEGLRYTAIARKVGVADSTVGRVARAAGIFRQKDQAKRKAL